MHQYDFFSLAENIDPDRLDDTARRVGMDPYSYLLVAHACECRQERRQVEVLRDGKRDERTAKERHRRIVHGKDPSRGTSKFSRNLLTDPGGTRDLMKELGLVGSSPDLITHLPVGAVWLEFLFTLEKPYLSRDDAAFYPIDNPIRKERIFKAPFVSGGTWKGSVRAAAVEGLLLRACADRTRAVGERIELVDIFGDEKGVADFEAGADEKTLADYLDRKLGREAFRRARAERYGLQAEDDEFHRQGRVQVSPSYFDAIDVDVINPRNRLSRAGTMPIEMEMVPPGAQSLFSLLYLPFDLLGEPEKMRKQSRRDWELLGEALVRMFRYTGFGAKKSNGAGKVSASITGFRFECRLPGFVQGNLTDLEELAGLHEFFEVTS